MYGLPRSMALKIAAVLSFLNSGYNVVGAMPLLFAGSAATSAAPDLPPFGVILLGFTTGVVGLVAAYGAWKQQRWGIVLTIVINLVNGLGAVPGILFAPVPFLTVMASLTVIISSVIIVLCLWRDRRPATA